MELSIFPGVGHIYLKNYHGIIFFLFGYVVLVVFGMVAKSEMILSAILSIFLIGIPMIALSFIDTEYQCNRLGLRFPDLSNKQERGLTIGINNFGRTYRIWVHIPAILGICVSIFSLKVDGYSIYTALIIVWWVIVFIVGEILIRKFRNLQASSFPHKNENLLIIGLKNQIDKAKSINNKSILNRKKRTSIFLIIMIILAIIIVIYLFYFSLPKQYI